jgi:HSP20 family protein
MPWDPLRDLHAWQERLVSHQREGWAPSIDVYETADIYVVKAEVPGLTRDHIDLALEDKRLTIRGQRPDHRATSTGTVRYHQVERGRGPFARTFEFAERIAAAEVTADLKDGVLTVTLPKRGEPPARKIEVG